MAMYNFRKSIATCVVCLICIFVLTAAALPQKPPTFSLAWSEYPSWSVFGVAHEFRLIDGREGKMGDIEKKWGVDIKLDELDYDSCMALYASLGCDAVCITNMDSLNPALSRKSVAILPTSTSYGADACIVTSDITEIRQLKGIKVYGLAKSVSEYCFVRNLELNNEKEADYKFTNMDPAAASLALQQGQKGYNSIVVWNPFVLETLNKRKDARVLFDSSTIPGEIIDMVVMAQASLDKPGGEDFAAAVIETFYKVNEMLADPNPEVANDTLIAIGEKFSHLGLKDMRKVMRQTLFYKTPKDGKEVLVSDKLPQIMTKVVDFSLSHAIVEKTPKVSYGAKNQGAEANLRFDPAYIDRYEARKGQ
jgi:ABC-type nitrate/sulfonate/bicarbonate transport system substrate-binding protein